MYSQILNSCNFWSWFFGSSEESIINKNLWPIEFVLICQLKHMFYRVTTTISPALRHVATENRKGNVKFETKSVFHRWYLTVVSRMCQRMDLLKNASGILIINQYIWHGNFYFINLLHSYSYLKSNFVQILPLSGV